MPAAVMQPAQNAFGGFALPPTSYVAPKPVPPPVKKAAPAKRPVTPESSRESDDDSDASFSSVEGSSKKRQPKKESSKKSSSSSSAAKKKKEADKKKKDADKKKKDASKKRSSSSKDKDKDDDEPKKKRAKPLNEDGTEKVNGFTRPYAISDTLYQVIGTYGETGPSGRIEVLHWSIIEVFLRTHGILLQRKRSCSHLLGFVNERVDAPTSSGQVFVGVHQGEQPSRRKGYALIHWLLCYRKGAGHDFTSIASLTTTASCSFDLCRQAQYCLRRQAESLVWTGPDQLLFNEQVYWSPLDQARGRGPTLRSSVIATQRIRNQTLLQFTNGPPSNAVILQP